MSNETNTALSTVLAESTAVAVFMADQPIPEDAKHKVRRVTEDAMEKAVKNVLQADKALKAYEGKTYDLVLNLVVLATDSLSRDMRDGIEINQAIDKEGIANAARKAVTTVKRELCVQLVWNGFPVYTNGVSGANFVRSLPARTDAQFNIKRHQAERYVDASKFRDGKPIAKPDSKVPELATQSYRDLYKLADSPVLADYIKTAAALATKAVSWLWINHRDIFTTLATRVAPDHVPANDADIGPYVDLDDATRETISERVSEKFGATLGEVKSATAKAKTDDGKSRLDSFMDWFSKESTESRATILQRLNNRHSELNRSADNAKRAFGMVLIESDDGETQEGVETAAA